MGRRASAFLEILNLFIFIKIHSPPQVLISPLATLSGWLTSCKELTTPSITSSREARADTESILGKEAHGAPKYYDYTVFLPLAGSNL